MSWRWHLAVLIVAALTMAMAPQWITGVPLEHQLSSDAEYYVAGMEAAVEPRWQNASASFPIDIRPRGELVVTRLLAEGALLRGVPLNRASVWLSVCALVTFVVGIYVLGRQSALPPAHALVLALMLIVPVHALGGTTLGFQALGLLPRDLALGAAVLVLALYVRAARRADGRLLVLVGALSGLLANFQSIVAAHLILTIGLAESIRRRSLSRALVGCGLAFALTAAPAIVDAIDKGLTSSRVDLALMRMRHAYMLATPVGEALTHYLRRFIIYAAMLLVLRLFIPRRRSDEDTVASVWWSIALSAAILAIAGVVVETTTIHAKYMLSRTSVYFMLAAMVLLMSEVPRLARWRGYDTGSAVALVVVVFVLQSNVASIYRYIRQVAATRSERSELLTVAQRLRERSQPNELFIAPSTETSDTAAMLRAYAARPTFVSYKDGGVSLVDGERARRWLALYMDLGDALASPDAATLVRWMRAHHVTFAVLPRGASHAAADLSGLETIHEGQGYVVVRAADAVPAGT